MTSRLPPKFKCAQCHVELGEFDKHFLPGETKFDQHSGLMYSTGVNYCEKCYKELTGESPDLITEKEIDKIPKNRETDIIIKVDSFKGKKGITIREFVKTDSYTGFTKAGTRIPVDKFKQFKDAINSIDEDDLS